MQPIKRLFGIAVLCMLASFAVSAQVCDVTYTFESETAEGNAVTSASVTNFGDPMADVLDDHKHQMKVLDALSKVQDKGGPYTVEVGEYRSCDGGAKVKVDEGSAMVKGVTLKGGNTVARVAYKEWDHILKRYEQRADKGDKTGWDHSKAKKVKRDPNTGKRTD